jgi:hypothetical protein
MLVSNPKINSYSDNDTTQSLADKQGFFLAFTSGFNDLKNYYIPK